MIRVAGCRGQNVDFISHRFSGYGSDMNAPQIHAEINREGWENPGNFEQAQQSNRLTLAWWGLIPVIAFIALQVVYGWPVAVARATTPDATVSYLVGSIIGGLLIPFGIAWVVYRMAGRSQQAATIAFSVVIGLICLGLVARPRPVVTSNGIATSSSNMPASTSGAPVLASFGVFQFEMPAGWTRVKPDAENTAAMILLNGATWDKSDGMMKVDVGKPTVPTARQMAQALAGKDGRVLRGAIMLDGAEGIRVQTTAATLSRPRYAVVVYRDGKAYLIMAGTNGADIAGAFARVLKTWRWGKTP